MSDNERKDGPNPWDVVEISVEVQRGAHTLIPLGRAAAPVEWVAELGRGGAGFALSLAVLEGKELKAGDVIRVKLGEVNQVERRAPLVPFDPPYVERGDG